MTRYRLVFAALLLATPAAAQSQDLPTSAGDQPPSGFIDSGSDPHDFDLARKKVVDCEGEKFVFAWGAGANPTKVTLCSNKNATSDDLVQMLDDAATKLERSNLAEDRRVAIVQQIRAKIAELRSGSAAASAPEAAVSTRLLTGPLVDSMPAPTPPQDTIARSTTPPAVQQPLGSAARPALAPKPRLSFECESPATGPTSGPCTLLEPRTRIIVAAEEALPGGIGLRFRRRGETRSEVGLGAMRKGQSVRLVLPKTLCAGVLKTESEIQVVQNGQVVESLGPYRLRC